MLGFLYLIFKSNLKSQPKSKEQKQGEIYEEYKRTMDSELSNYLNDKDTLVQKKTALLKVFAGELHRNMFFDEQETRELIQKLAKYEVNSGK